MSDSPASLELARLDDCSPASLDPAVWPRNLAAIAAVDAEFARQIAKIAPPPHWQPVAALDGFLTFRLEPPGQAPQWLGGTAAPKCRTEGLLGTYEAAGKNPALPTIGAGAELCWLLERLDVLTATYVFESDLEVLVATLRAHDFADSIAAGRCLIVPPGREHAYLSKLLTERPGLLPPGTILLPDIAPKARLEELRDICERIHAECSQQRAASLAKLKTRMAGQARPPSGRPRLALLALASQAAPQQLARQLADAAEELDWPCLVSAATGPSQVHAIVHCSALVDFSPEIVIGVGCGPDVLPALPPAAIARWHLSVDEAPASIPADQTLHLAASPRIAAALRAAGAEPSRVLDWFWACPSPPAAKPDESPAAGPAPTGSVVIIGNLPPREPSIYGLQQATQQRLWSAIFEVAARCWESPRVLDAAGLLSEAQRACGVQLSDNTLGDTFRGLIRRIVVPAVVLERLAAAVQHEGLTVSAIGSGWERLGGKGLAVARADVLATLGGRDARTPLGGRDARTPLRGRGADPTVIACLTTTCVDPLSPALLRAAAAGWPILVHAANPAGLADLGGVLQGQTHFQALATVRELTGALRSIRSLAATIRDRAARAAEHVQAYHTCRHRLAALAEHLRA